MRFLTIIFIFACCVCLSYGLKNNICRALALEGGGSQGAYQVGALKAFLELLQPEDVAYDVIAGASVGALNGMLISAFPKGAEKEMWEQMNYLWSIIKNSNIYTGWTMGWIRGFIDKPSFLDNSPLKPFLKERMKEVGSKLYRKFSIGIVDANSAKTIRYNSSIGGEEAPTYVVGSASIPGFFPPLKKDGYVFVDGGVNDNMNLRGAVMKCLEMTGGDQSSIIVDYIMTNPLKHDAGDYSQATTRTQYYRGKDLRTAINYRWHCNYTQKAYPKINWRYAVIPQKDVSDAAVPLNFDQKELKKFIEQGYNDAVRVIKGETPSFQDQFASSQPPRIRL